MNKVSERPCKLSAKDSSGRQLAMRLCIVQIARAASTYWNEPLGFQNDVGCRAEICHKVLFKTKHYIERLTILNLVT